MTTAKKDKDEPIAAKEAVIVVEDKAPEPEPEAPKGPKLREYVVTAGAAIAPLGNHKKAKAEFGERARMYTSGEVVMLTAKEARHYVELRRLDPYVPEDEE